MKKIIVLAGAFMAFSVMAFSQKVGSDEKYSAEIEKYSTYNWVDNIDKIPENKVFVGPGGVLIYNNESTRNKIKDAIKYELSARGYKISDNPDFYVSFQVLEQPTELITNNGYEVIRTHITDTVVTEDNMVTVPVKAGTVMINFIDKSNSEQVWQGYVSGILHPDMINSTPKVRQAISSIFREYDYKASTAKR